MKRRLLAFVVVFGGILGTLLCGTNAFAAVDESVIMRKWYLTEFYNNCADSEKMNQTITASQVAEKKNNLVKEDIFKKKGQLKLPAYGFGGVKDSKKTITCYDMFVGSSASGTGLLDLSKLKKYSGVK